MNLTVLHFLLQDLKVCIDLNYIEKILPLPMLETIPSSPVYFVGLMNFKNKCLSVIDLALAIGSTRDQTYPLNIPILLCSDGTQQMGLIVDKVLGLSEIDENKITAHEEFTSKDSPFVGTLTLESGVSLLINVSWIFSLKLRQETQHFLKRTSN